MTSDVTTPLYRVSTYHLQGNQTRQKHQIIGCLYRNFPKFRINIFSRLDVWNLCCILPDCFTVSFRRDRDNWLPATNHNTPFNYAYSNCYTHTRRMVYQWRADYYKNNTTEFKQLSVLKLRQHQYIHYIYIYIYIYIYSFI